MNRFVLISFLISAFSSVSQQKVDLSIEPATAEIGETFEITITSSIAGNIDFGNLPNEFLQDNTIRQGTQQQTDLSGNRYVAHYYSITGIIKKPGNYTFGPVIVTSSNKSYVSNTAVINISPKVKMKSGVVTNAQFRDPAFGVIEVNKTTLYEGEPLLIRGKVYARYNPSHINNYDSYDINGAIVKYPIGNGSSFKTRIVNFRGEDFYALDNDKNIIFPTGVGRVTIDPFKLNLHQGIQSFPIESSPLSITVLSLPPNPPKDFIGAVGDFSVSRKIPEKKFEQGDVIKMLVEVSGSGNLHNITIPQLNLPKGFTIYGDPVITENYSMGVRGSEGSITYEFNVEVTVAGKTSLPSMSITYFDPEQEKYIQVTTESDSLQIKASKEYEQFANDQNNEHRTEELIVQEFNPRENSGNVKPGDIYGTGLFWGGVSIPILSAFLFLFFIKGRENAEEKAAEKAKKTKRSSAINENLISARNAVSVSDSKAFYDALEKTLRSSFTGAMTNREAKILSKQEMIEFAQVVGVDFKTKVQKLLEECEIAKYSFGHHDDLRPVHLKELEEIVQQLSKKK